MSKFESERESLQRRILTVTDENFDDIAFDLFSFQIRYNSLYGDFVRLLGIDPDQIASVFDWAFQSNQKQSTGKHGAGIGLFVSKAVIDAHGGTIGIESVPNEKTIVWFEIPIS